MEQLNREHNDIDWLSSYFSHHKFTFKGKKAEKVSMIKAHIACCCTIQWSVNNLGSHRLQMCVASDLSLSEVETELKSDLVDQVLK